ncbi:MAG: Crp/Fnr family transcriptional regulator [Pseudomonadota bacterium]
MDVLVHNNSVITALSTCQLFKSVEWHTIKQLSDSSKLIRLDRGQMVFHSGESELGLFLVKSGQVKVSILASNGSERVIDVVSPGGTFGEDGLFSPMLSRLNAVMLENGEVIEIPRKSIECCLKKCPALASSMLSHLGSKLCRLVGELENCCLRTARQRVIDYLLILANQQQPGTDQHLNIQLPAGKGVIASLLDITPETFSRELNRLNSMGLIQVERKTIQILDLSGMQQSII